MIQPLTALTAHYRPTAPPPHRLKNPLQHACVYPAAPETDSMDEERKAG